ncbi:MAG: APC family permease, partial [Actinomycetota bacterium]|nr:APC family permease [Actinomycetota bacterium]
MDTTATPPPTPAATPLDAAPGHKGLKPDALGYISNLVIAIASTAPAYSLAATLGFIVAVGGVGVHAPAVLIVSFIPILFVSVGYRFFNLADPDAGTTFAWVTRAFGPQLGWINGWAIFLADIIVMASLAAIASNYTFLLFDSTATPSNFLLIVGAVVWIAVMTWICYRGIELSARVQTVLLSFEIVTLALFTVVALIKVYANSPAHSLQVSASWFNPFDLSWGALVDGVLLGIFIYWGWDSGVAVNEESRDRRHGPGKAAVVSTLVLLLIYVAVSAAAQSYHGPSFLSGNSTDVLNALGGQVFGSPLDKLMIIAVLTSASASTQTTILPTARTTLSMARWNAIPEAFGRVHPRFFTPTFSTVLMGALSIVWTVALLAFNPSQNVLGDAVAALGFAICFYYGFTGLACAAYFRRDLFKSV